MPQTLDRQPSQMRSGYQCTACGTSMHQGLTASILEARLHEECPQVLIEDIRNHPSMQIDSLPKKLTRAQHIKELLAKQADQPDTGKHHLAETTGYLKCTKCGVNIHKRVNEAAFTEFIHMHTMRDAVASRQQPAAHSHPGTPQTLQGCSR